MDFINSLLCAHNEINKQLHLIITGAGSGKEMQTRAQIELTP